MKLKVFGVNLDQAAIRISTRRSHREHWHKYNLLKKKKKQISCQLILLFENLHARFQFLGGGRFSRYTEERNAFNCLKVKVCTLSGSELVLSNTNKVKMVGQNKSLLLRHSYRNVNDITPRLAAVVKRLKVRHLKSRSSNPGSLRRSKVRWWGGPDWNSRIILVLYLR